MSEDRIDTLMGLAPEIRIEGLNSDKTRKDVGSESVYHVYFELSRHPTAEWTSLFEREWKGLNLKEMASIDGAFLVLHCTLQEVATRELPALKKAVAATNEAYKGYVQEGAMALEHRQDLLKQERKDVDAMSSSLEFD